MAPNQLFIDYYPITKSMLENKEMDKICDTDTAKQRMGKLKDIYTLYTARCIKATED